MKEQTLEDHHERVLALYYTRAELRNHRTNYLTAYIAISCVTNFILPIISFIICAVIIYGVYTNSEKTNRLRERINELEYLIKEFRIGD